jgi:5-methylcytosine-specific restriction protein A
MCAGHGMLVPAFACDHIEPHRGDERLFWAGPFQSLCENCHNSSKKLIEGGRRHPKAYTGEDGWPIVDRFITDDSITDDAINEPPCV